MCSVLCASFWVVSLPIAQLQVFKHTEGKNSLACFGCLTINTFASGSKECMRKWVFCFYKLCLSSSSLWSILLHKWIGWGHYRTSRDKNHVLLDWISTEVTTPKATFLMVVFYSQIHSESLFSLHKLNKCKLCDICSFSFRVSNCFFALIWSSKQCCGSTVR